MVDKEELHRIRRFTSRSEGTKAINTLKGIITGINLDKVINETEVKELDNWAKVNYDLISISPFNEIIPFVKKICEDGIITEEEYKDLSWLVESILNRKGYYDIITCKLQELEGIFHGVLADNNITDEEIKNLEEWLFDNEELIGTYPFDENEALLIGITEDGIITDKERNYLKLFISEFVSEKNSKTIDFEAINKLKNDITISGVCTINPLIEFKNKQFCFTGISKKYKRKDVVELIENKGGFYNDNVTEKTDFLIIGQNSNPCWAYSCYGRKVEKAMDMRKRGSRISIVKEIDFEDAAIE